ncbi:MAG TPA: hypothetical protein GX707_01710, partial [Epulopiscium sp.]|nr:hypothetical protein [Candidatus Epulonipiscium sp.]
MKRKNIKKAISMVLVILMSFSSMVFATGGDYTEHWAEEAIKSWIEMGYIKGYPDGSFKPENEITRAEFIVIVNRSFGFTEEAEVTYKDVTSSHWAYNEFKKASAAGYIGGFEDGTLRPNNKISRQEMAVIIARLLGANEALNSEAFLGLDDINDIPEWSAGAVSALVDKGYVRLRYGNSFASRLPATRAEVIDSLNNSYLSLATVQYNEAGIYGAGIVNGNVAINVKDVMLKNTTITGDLIIGEAVGDGNVFLDNVDVKGDTIVKGGGMNSIMITDSNISNLIIEKKDGKVRILVKGNTYVSNIDMQSGGKLESSSLSADNFGYVVVGENISSGEPIILAGNFKSVEVRTGNNDIRVQSGTIANLEISKTAKNVAVYLAAGVKVDRVDINVAAHIDGRGKIGTAFVNVNNIKLTAEANRIIKAAGVDKAKPSRPRPSRPSTDGGEDNPPEPVKVAVKDITVTSDKDATTITTNKGSLQMSTKVMPDNASNKAVIWSTEPSSIATINQYGLLTAVADGTVTVKATAKDGSRVVGSKVVTVSGQEETADPVEDLTVKSISSYDPINIKVGGAYTLPTSNDITLSDDSVTAVPVTWDETGVKVNVASTYEVKGTLDVSGLANVA